MIKNPFSSASPGFVDAHTRMAVSINAKSDYDSVHVFLEEVPWGQIGLDLKEATPLISPTATSNSGEFYLLAKAIPYIFASKNYNSVNLLAEIVIL